MKRKVRVKRYGGTSTSEYALRSPGRNSGQFPVYYPGTEFVQPSTEVNNTYPEADREDANLEAERGETIWIPDVGGLPAHFDIGGSPHSDGGTPLKADPGSFIFSQTPSLKIKGPVLEYFGINPDSKKGKKGVKIADIAKQYDLNKYRKLYQDPTSTPETIKTQEMHNIPNAEKKLAMLALVQEAKKGFPDGIPDIAIPYMVTAKVEPQQILPQMQMGGGFQNGPQGTGYQTGGQPGGEEEQIMQIIQAYAEAQGIDPKEVIMQLKQMQPEQAQQALQQMAQTVQGGQPAFGHGGSLPRYQEKGEVVVDPFAEFAKMRQQQEAEIARQREINKRAEALHQTNTAQSEVNWEIGRKTRQYKREQAELLEKSKPLIKKLYDPYANWRSATENRQTVTDQVEKAKKEYEMIAKKIKLAQDPALYKFNNPTFLPSYVSYLPDQSDFDYTKWSAEQKAIAAKAAEANKKIAKPVVAKPTAPITRQDSIQIQKTMNQQQGIMTPPVVPPAAVDTIDVASPSFLRRGGMLPKAVDGKSVQKVERAQDGSTRTTYADGTVEIKNPSGQVVKPKAGAPTAKGAAPAAAPANIANLDLYTPEWQQYILQRAQGKKITPEMIRTWLPARVFDASGNLKQDFKGSVPGMQHKRTSGAFGKEDWWGDPQLKADFIRRHGDIIKQYEAEHPGKQWDPTKLDAKDAQGQPVSSDMQWFEQQYNKMAQEKGYPAYNFGKQGRFGELSYSVPSLNEPPADAPPAQGPPAAVPQQNYAAANLPAEWWAEDKVKSVNDFVGWMGVRKELPWAQKVNARVPRAVFPDDTRAQALNAEQMAVASQAAGMFSGPQRLSAQQAQISGQAAKNAADISGNLFNQTVPVANQYEALKASIYSNADAQNAGINTKLHDATAVANEQYRNAKTQWRDRFATDYGQALTNRAMAYNMNLVSPHYKISPRRSGEAYFYSGSPLTAASDQTGYIRDLQQLQEAFPLGLQPGVVDAYKASMGDVNTDERLQRQRDKDFVTQRGYPAARQ